MLNKKEKEKTEAIWALHYKVLAKIWRAIGHCFKQEWMDQEEKMVLAHMSVVEVLNGLRKTLNGMGYNYSFKEYLSLLEGAFNELEEEKKSHGHREQPDRNADGRDSSNP